MRYHITLTITYDYQGMAANGRHLLRLMPATIPGLQRMVAGHVQLNPQPDETTTGHDFFGNTTQSLVYHHPHREIDIALSAHVQRFEPVALLNMSGDLANLPQELALQHDLGPHSPLHFLAHSPRIRASETLAAFARSLLLPGITTLEAARAIGEGLHRYMTFDTEATEVETSPEDAFTLGRGVCQDYTQIMIACLRAVGIPAGYVSGFLRTLPPPGKPRMVGADAMHAWVRAWCGADVGWVEFDPTNAVPVGLDHIVVAYGRDYSDVAPVKGISRLTGGHAGRHTVDVAPED